MPRPRFEKLPKEKKEMMLETAAREFSAHGYRGASLNHILEAAGISKGAAYYYFDSKADLFATVISGYMKHLLDESGFDLASVTRANFWSMVEELRLQNIKHAYESPFWNGLFRAAQDLTKEDQLEEPLKQVYDFAMHAMDLFISKGMELGKIRSDLPKDLLSALMVGLDQAGDRWLLDNWNKLSPDQIEKYSRLHMDAIRRVVEPR